MLDKLKKHQLQVQNSSFRDQSFLKQWRGIFKDIRAYSFFIQQLVRIGIIKDFKRSFIGIFWLFLLPILSVIVWIILNSAGIINPGETEIPYPAFVLISTSIWNFFIKIYGRCSNVLIAKSRILITTPFPRIVLVAEAILVELIQFIIPFLINILVLLLFGIKFTLLALLFPFTLIPLLLLGAAIGLIVALLRVVATDIAKLIDQALGFIMFLTPIVYAPSISISWLSPIIQLNPLTYLIGFSRDILTQGSLYEPIAWGVCFLLSLFLFLLSVRLFFISEPKMIEKLIMN